LPIVSSQNLWSPLHWNHVCLLIFSLNYVYYLYIDYYVMYHVSTKKLFRADIHVT
jgi:hypothetical protein